jgi:hypothetical protein
MSIPSRGLRSGSGAGQRGDGLLVSWIDALEAVNVIEGPIRGEDCVDSTVERQGGKDGVPGVETGMSLEEVDSALHIIYLYRVPPSQLGDVADRLGDTRSVSRAPRSLVRELLQQICAGLALEFPGARSAHDFSARLSVGMLSAQGVAEDCCVIEKAPHALSHLRIGASSISRF